MFTTATFGPANSMRSLRKSACGSRNDSATPAACRIYSLALTMCDRTEAGIGTRFSGSSPRFGPSWGQQQRIWEHLRETIAGDKSPPTFREESERARQRSPKPLLTVGS